MEVFTSVNTPFPLAPLADQAALPTTHQLGLSWHWLIRIRSPGGTAFLNGFCGEWTLWCTQIYLILQQVEWNMWWQQAMRHCRIQRKNCSHMCGLQWIWDIYLIVSFIYQLMLNSIAIKENYCSWCCPAWMSSCDCNRTACSWNWVSSSAWLSNRACKHFLVGVTHLYLCP